MAEPRRRGARGTWDRNLRQCRAGVLAAQALGHAVALRRRFVAFRARRAELQFELADACAQGLGLVAEAHLRPFRVEDARAVVTVEVLLEVARRI